MDTLWYSHTLKYNKAKQTNKQTLLAHVTAWINLTVIILNKRNQAQQSNCCMILFIWSQEQTKLMIIEIRWVVSTRGKYRLSLDKARGSLLGFWKCPRSSEELHLIGDIFRKHQTLHLKLYAFYIPNEKNQDNHNTCTWANSSAKIWVIAIWTKRKLSYYI